MGFLDNTGVSRLWEHVNALVNTRVPTSRKVNGKSLAGDITLTAADVGATDTKVNTNLATTTKAYLLGTSTTPTSTVQAVTSVADTGVYLTTTGGELYVGQLQTSKIVPTGGSYSLQIRNHGANAYTVAAPSTAAIGSESQPVYVDNKGMIKACTSIAATTDQEGNVINTSYLKLSGGTVTGEVNSSAAVAISNAAFRNIKAVPSTTEIIAGQTAIPTGEIWVRFE